MDGNQTLPFAGGVDCAADYVLARIDESFVYKPEYDLISFIRSIYIMLHEPDYFPKLSFGKEDGVTQISQSVADFWKYHARSEFWKEMYDKAQHLDYEGLIHQLEELF